MRIRAYGLSAIIIIIGLLAIDLGLNIRGAIAAKRTAQVTIIADQRTPDVVTLAFNISAWQPSFHNLADNALTCDGVALHYASPIPQQNFSGFTGQVLAMPVGGAYRCSFHDWRETVSLTIPVRDGDVPNVHIELSDQTPLMLDQTVHIPFHLSGSPSQLMLASLTDQQSHHQIPLRLSYGPNGGDVEFRAPAAAGLVAGHSTFALFDRLIIWPSAPGWDSLSFLYENGRSSPVMLVDNA